MAGFLRSDFDRDCLGVCRVGVRTPHWDVNHPRPEGRGFRGLLKERRITW